MGSMQALLDQLEGALALGQGIEAVGGSAVERNRDLGRLKATEQVEHLRVGEAGAVGQDLDHHAQLVGEGLRIGEVLVDHRFAASELQPQHSRVSEDVQESDL